MATRKKHSPKRVPVKGGVSIHVCTECHAWSAVRAHLQGPAMAPCLGRPDPSRPALPHGARYNKTAQPDTERTPEP